MATRSARDVRGMERGPHTIQYTAFKVQCPTTFIFEVAYAPEIDVYADMICIHWDCRSCVAGNNPFPARHTAVLPAASYISPDAIGGCHERHD